MYVYNYGQVYSQLQLHYYTCIGQVHVGLLVYFQHMFRNRQLYVDHVYIHFQVVYTCVLYLHSLYVQLYSHSCVCVCVCVCALDCTRSWCCSAESS